ncbi:DODA-type extradiol aromatic ring-opening family dioxygenase [Sphingomonas sp. GCM10030256]|uniref:DODA-type extradiol aromatic ring-opening family dioxygenase n=1 Tax=Sphingomonas sp. GCM10030256 TaxID=3273427 RepID=UPI003622559E
MLNPIFLSHGSPMLPFEDHEARAFLRSLGQDKNPQAILMVSAHWETDIPAVNAVARNSTIHDFHGFPPELYRLRYDAPGSLELADWVRELLETAGFPITIDRERGLDHGAWAPLLLAWPEADIPVVQLSVQPDAGPEHHFRLGCALQPLVNEGVLIIGSGSFTHDLSSWRTHRGQPEPDWVRDFAEWMDKTIAEGRTPDLLAYREKAPNAARNHPTEEHLLPLFVALGAAGEGASSKRLHSSVAHSVLRMDAYELGGSLDREHSSSSPVEEVAARQR